MEEIILKELIKHRSLDTCNDLVIWADISDLQPLAKKIKEAINYSQCCTQLKVKEGLTFNEWIEHSGYKNYGCYDYRRNAKIFTRDMLAEKYKTYNKAF